MEKSIQNLSDCRPKQRPPNDNIPQKTESLEGFIAHDLPNMISTFVAPVVMLVLVFAVDWRFGLAAFVGIIFSFLIYGVTSGGDKTKKLMEDYQTSLEDMSNASVEYIRGIAVVKAFRQTAFSFKRLYDSIKNYTKTVIPYSRTISCSNKVFWRISAWDVPRNRGGSRCRG